MLAQLESGIASKIAPAEKVPVAARDADQRQRAKQTMRWRLVRRLQRTSAFPSRGCDLFYGSALTELRNGAE